MSSSYRYFRREFLAKPDDDSSNIAVTARVSNMTQNSDPMAWLSARLSFTELSDYMDVQPNGGFALSFYGSEDKEMTDALRQVEVLRKIVNDFADAVMAEVEAAKALPKD